MPRIEPEPWLHQFVGRTEIDGGWARRGKVQGVRFELTNSYETRTST